MTTVAHGRDSGEILRGVALMLLLLAVPVGLAALASSAGVLRLPFELMLIDRKIPLTFRLHMISAGLALVMMPIAIAVHGHKVHKHFGRSAALLGLIGAVTALPVAVASEAAGMARAGFFVQGLAWMGCILTGVAAIRAGDLGRHRRWMLLGTAVATGAIWLRLASWVTVALDGPFAAVYAASAWLAWVLPAGAVLLLLRRDPLRPASREPGAARPSSARSS